MNLWNLVCSLTATVTPIQVPGETIAVWSIGYVIGSRRIELILESGMKRWKNGVGFNLLR
jgi:hypothetical protein